MKSKEILDTLELFVNNELHYDLIDKDMGKKILILVKQLQEYADQSKPSKEQANKKADELGARQDGQGKKHIDGNYTEGFMDCFEWMSEGNHKQTDWDEIHEGLKTFCYTQHDDTPSIGGKCIDYLKSIDLFKRKRNE